MPASCGSGGSCGEDRLGPGSPVSMVTGVGGFLPGCRIVVQQGQRQGLRLRGQRRELPGQWWLLCGGGPGLGVLGNAVSGVGVPLMHGVKVGRGRQLCHPGAVERNTGAANAVWIGPGAGVPQW